MQIAARKNGRLWNVISAAILIISIIKGLRYPSAWAYTHYLFNYSFGFTKRALIGTLINLLGIPYLKSYEFFVISSTILFLADMVLIYLSIRDFINSGNKMLIGCAIIFASSLAIIFLSHTIGYFEHLGLLTTLIAMRIKGFYKKLSFLVPAFTITLLAHEVNLIIFFLVIFISLLLDIKPGNDLKKLVALGAFSAAMVGLVFYISNSTIAKKAAYQMYKDAQAEAGKISLRKDAFVVLVKSTNDNLKRQYQMWENRPMLNELEQSFLVTLPSIFTLIYLTLSILKKSGAKVLLIAFSILASISPFILHFLAWDMDRWNTLAITTSFLVLSIVYNSDKSSSADLSDSVYPILIFVLFLNATATIVLFDEYTVQQFPFREHQKYILDIISGRTTFP